MLLIDAANVVGSRPTGWWKDRAAAAGDLVTPVRAATADAAATEEVVLVSADRGLGARVRRQGGELVGPRWLLERLA